MSEPFDFDSWAKPDEDGPIYVVRYRLEVLVHADQNVIGSSYNATRQALTADGAAAWKAECIKSEIYRTDEGSLFQQLVDTGNDLIGIEVETRSVRRLVRGPKVPLDWDASTVKRDG